TTETPQLRIMRSPPASSPHIGSYQMPRPVHPLTHALAAYTLKRAAFPRLPRAATIAMLIAGTVVDIDSLSAYFGPSVFLTFYRTYCHSLPAGFLFSLLATILFLLRRRGQTEPIMSPVPIFL